MIETKKQAIKENIKLAKESGNKLTQNIDDIGNLFSIDSTGKNNEEQIILNEILNSKFKNICFPLDNFSIKETLPIIKNCNLSICNDSSFSHLSAALGIKTITLMVDTPIIYGNYNSKMFPIIPEGVETVNHHTDGKEKINPEKVYKKVIEILN